MCDWATCNLILHFSGTLLGSARGTGLLPVCGRNLYNWLCSFFFCSLHLSAAQRLWTHSDFEPENNSSERKRRSFQKHNSTPPSCGFSHLHKHHHNSLSVIQSKIKNKIIINSKTYSTVSISPNFSENLIYIPSPLSPPPPLPWLSPPHSSSLSLKSPPSWTTKREVRRKIRWNRRWDYEPRLTRITFVES